jgi:glycosyltransferase involved in cell wall biosynthesis
MKLLLIADAFPPMRTSASVHMYELTLELIEQKHEVTVVIPTAHVHSPLKVELKNGFRLISIPTFKTKDVGYLRRTIAEYLSPYTLYMRLKSSSIIEENFDGIIWYSPTIFFGPLISRLKAVYKCPAYLVLRDMFPDWAVDIGLMKKRFPYYFFKFIEISQYRAANFVGIQAPGNFKYFDKGFLKKFKPKVELLWTWVTPSNSNECCSINLNKTNLAGRTIFIYAGNMGIAQEFDLIMTLVSHYKNQSDVGFVFVGRGSEVDRLKAIKVSNSLDNIIFYDEIDSTEIPSLYSQCDIGLVALDPRHKSNNIPGKFLSYMAAGLPVLARLNPGNDLADLITKNQVGGSYIGTDSLEFKSVADKLINAIMHDENISHRCKNLAHTLFSTRSAVKQIIGSLTRGH